MSRYSIFLYLMTILTSVLPFPAQAVPAEIILLRHGEKINPYRLSSTGEERAIALAHVYLGKKAKKSILPKGVEPGALLTMTLHTIETMAPTAQSWRMPETVYTAVPEWNQSHVIKKEQETIRTQQAAHALLHDAQYNGKIIIVMWEHTRIASAKLERRFPGQPVTFRQLLHLSHLRGVPETWPNQNFDYFWIIKYQGENPIPISFRMVKQVYDGKYKTLPQNAWRQSE